jgi:hypothetical protein
MARRERPRATDQPAGQPRLVEVSVIVEPGAHDSRGIGIVQATITASLVAALAVLVITTVVGSDHRSAPTKPAPAQSAPATKLAPVLPSPAEPTPPEPAATRSLHASPATARESGPAGVAAAYGYPPRCLSVTIAPADPSYARADYNRVSACGRYDGTVTAIFHRVDGEWRPVLDAIGYSCPIASLSRAVASELAVCP